MNKSAAAVYFCNFKLNIIYKSPNISSNVEFRRQNNDFQRGLPISVTEGICFRRKNKKYWRNGKVKLEKTLDILTKTY